jgi:hypothetical protein
MQIKGLDELKRRLDNLQRRAENLHGTHSIPISELLTSSFMQRHTKFETFDAMLEASGFTVETPSDFEAIPDDEWDKFVASATPFSSWQAMLSDAGAAWAKKELGL